MITSPDIQKQTPSCSDISQQKAKDQIKELYDKIGIDEVPTGPGRDYITTLVLIAKGYNFGGITFSDAQLKIHDVDWRKTDEKTSELKDILKTGNYEGFENNR